jgi:hypothetical protein
MQRFFEVAISPTTVTVTADEALTKLNSYHGKHASDLLVRIALADRDFVDDQQEIAIRMIAERDDPNALASLTDLLQPHIELARREAVAKALQKGICTTECVRSVLHYEERLWCCHIAKESVLALVSDQYVRSRIEKDHDEMLALLDAALIRNGPSTVQVLRDVYGLGSPDPSPFTLHVIESLHLRRACPALAKSEYQLLDSSQKDEIEGLLKDLNCAGDNKH